MGIGGKGWDGRGGPRACPLQIISGYATGQYLHAAVHISLWTSLTVTSRNDNRVDGTVD